MATLNPELADFWFDGPPSAETFIKVRNRVLYGGRASSKSWEFAGMAQEIGSKYKTRFLCVRRFQNKIKDSVYTLIKAQIERFKTPGYNVMATEILHENGTDFTFYGIDRNPDEIKSFEGADILWIEEAHNLTADQWEILEPTIRKANSEVWVSFNPKLMTDFVYQRFIVNPPPNTRVRLVNYTHNPFLSQTMRDVIEAKRLEDWEEYEHVYLGVPRSDDDSSVIKRSWIEAAIDAHITLELKGIKLGGARTVGYDVADSGDDKNAASAFNGAICEELDEWKGGEDELAESAMRASRLAKDGFLVYDSIGVGAHVGSTLSNAEVKHGYSKFNAAGAVISPDDEYAPGVTNREKFENLKAQAWQDVADRFRNTYNAISKGQVFEASQLISISGEIKHLERLKTELSSPRKSVSKRGLDVVESKEQMAKRGIASPNLADSFIMGACPHLVERSGYSWEGF